jgi:hypothetical protein
MGKRMPNEVVDRAGCGARDVSAHEVLDRHTMDFLVWLIKVWEADLSARKRHEVLRRALDNIFQTICDRDRDFTTRRHRTPRPRCSRKRNVRSN